MTGVTVKRETLIKYIRKQVYIYWSNSRGNYAGFFDEIYYLPMEGELVGVFGGISYPPYAVNEFDCEDFSFTCKAEISRRVRVSPTYNTTWATGIAWGHFAWMQNGNVDHTCNWVVLNTGILRWYEPQNGQFYPVDACTGELVLLLG